MKLNLFIYGITWLFVKYATFAKGWDLGIVSIVTFFIVLIGFKLFIFGRSLLENGQQHILFIITMVSGAVVFYLDEFHDIGWFVKFPEPADTIFRIISAGICIFMIIKITRMFILGREE